MKRTALLLSLALALPTTASAQPWTPWSAKPGADPWARTATPPPPPTFVPAPDPPEGAAPDPAPDPDPPTAPEPPAPRFGEKGEVVLVGAYAYASSTRFDNSDASFVSLGFGPQVHWFVVKNLSLGLDFELQWSDSTGYGADSSLVSTKTTLVSGGPVVGYNVPFGDFFSFWPHVTLGVHHRHVEQSLVSGSSLSTGDATGSPSYSQDGPWIHVHAPLLVHPTPHFFVGFGPSLYHDFARAQGVPGVGAESTTLGAGLTVGGWFGGPAGKADDETPPETSPRRRRFGDAGQLVLDTELGLGGSSTSYTDSPASSSGWNVAPGLDYFVEGRFSIGAFASLSKGSSTNVGSGGTTIERDDTSYGFGPRVGFDIPIAEAVSLYPRLSVAISHDSHTQTPSNGPGYTIDSTALTLGAYAPLVVHPAPHFFAGVGPSFTHDLSRSLADGRTNEGTTIGASFLLGGWL